MLVSQLRIIATTRSPGPDRPTYIPVLYCSPVCAKANWKEHKPLCWKPGMEIDRVSSERRLVFGRAAFASFVAACQLNLSCAFSAEFGEGQAAGRDSPVSSVLGQPGDSVWETE